MAHGLFLLLATTIMPLWTFAYIFRVDTFFIAWVELLGHTVTVCQPNGFDLHFPNDYLCWIFSCAHVAICVSSWRRNICSNWPFLLLSCKVPYTLWTLVYNIDLSLCSFWFSSFILGSFELSCVTSLRQHNFYSHHFLRTCHIDHISICYRSNNRRGKQPSEWEKWFANHKEINIHHK
jgi:hypothetical protein